MVATADNSHDGRFFSIGADGDNQVSQQETSFGLSSGNFFAAHRVLTSGGINRSVASKITPYGTYAIFVVARGNGFLKILRNNETPSEGVNQWSTGISNQVNSTAPYNPILRIGRIAGYNYQFGFGIDGKIAKFLLYPGVLSQANITTVVNDLNSYYGGLF